MEKFVVDIQEAFRIYPIVALLFTVLYVGWNYHKYGSIRSLRVLIVYSFVMYMLCVVCLIVLPLPSAEEAASLSGHTMQLEPFRFIEDMRKDVGDLVSIADPSSWGYILNSYAFLYTIFNVFMMIPFGMYMKYYFQFNFIETVLLSFLLSLLFEISQLTGLFFIYPGSYRIFDVDDLITNTAGGMIGWLLAIPLCHILPSREEMDQASYSLGRHVSLMRRMASFLFDVLVCVIIGTCVYLFFHYAPRIESLQPYMTKLNQFKMILKSPNIPVLFALYLILFSFITDGLTPGLMITSLRVANEDKKRAKRSQCLIRSGLFSIVMVLIPWFIYHSIRSISTASLTDEVLTSIVTGIWVIGCVVMWFRMFMHQPTFYEKLSHTRVTSTVSSPEKN